MGCAACTVMRWGEWYQIEIRFCWGHNRRSDALGQKGLNTADIVRDACTTFTLS
jgi:hypothetical protein